MRKGLEKELKKDCFVLGISLTHESSAALMKNGEVIAVAAEERFSRVKNDNAYPKRAIDFCLHWGRIEPEELTQVVLSGKLYPYENFKYRREAQFSVDDWVYEQHAFWYPNLIEKKKISYDEAFQDVTNLTIDDSYDPHKHGLSGNDILPILKEKIAVHLGINTSFIQVVPHEYCHKYYAYFSSFLRRDGIIFTAEGSGDYSNGTTSLVTSHQIVEQSATKKNHLAHLYRYATLLLGMKPNEHEYKVMGLAPYASEKEKEKVLKKLQGLFRVEGLNIVLGRHQKDFYFSLRDLLEGCRFDGVAGGLQEYVEIILCAWVAKACNILKRDAIYLSGGMAQNIKACKAIAELPEVDAISVMPISGDGSVALGAAYIATARCFDGQNISRNTIEPLSTAYLGPSYVASEIDKAITQHALGRGYRIVQNPTIQWIVGQLATGKILARFSGRMEFGQRALGNRSILADPRSTSIIERLNRQIKHRDFWMPFTPTVLSGRAAEYIVNPKNLHSPYMTMAFASTPKAQTSFPAALHPADKTIRPQLLEESQNPSYYEIIKEFENTTGIGAVLNTSFNLHGEPIVESPTDAVDVFNRSELDILLFDHTALCRNL